MQTLDILMHAAKIVFTNLDVLHIKYDYNSVLLCALPGTELLNCDRIGICLSNIIFHFTTYLTCLCVRN
jgi:hypothetical protein